MTIRSLNRNTNVIKRITKSRTASDLTRRRSIKQVIAGEGKPDFFIKWMIVAAGGEGGAAVGAGGGGGGIVIGINYLSPTGNLTYGTNYPIAVGGGGGYAAQGRGGSGGDSSFLGFIAYGGGGGGGYNPGPGANQFGRSAGTGGGQSARHFDFNDPYGNGSYIAYGLQGGTGGVPFIISYEKDAAPSGEARFGFGRSNATTQDGGGDRTGKSGNDSFWFDSDPTLNNNRNINPAYSAPGPLVFRGYGGGGGGGSGFGFDSGTNAGTAGGEGGDGGSGYAFGFENNFLQGPIANFIWGISQGGGGSSNGYEHNMTRGYYGPTPAAFPNAPGGVKTGFGSVRDGGDSWTGRPNFSPNGDGIGYNPGRGNPGEPWHQAGPPGSPGNSFPPFGWKTGFGENMSPGGPAPQPFTSPAGYHSMNGLPNSGQGGGGRWNGSSFHQWACQGPFWGADSYNPGAPNWLGRAGANTGGKGGSGVVFLSYPQVFGNCSNTGSPDVYVTTDGFRIYTFRGSGSITIDYDPN